MPFYNALAMLNKKKTRRVALGSRVSFEGLPQIQPVFLLQTMVAVSQALNNSAVHAEALARGLVLDGQRRLNGLRQAAPHLPSSLEQILELARSNGRGDDDLSIEERAIQAILEVCLGLVLEWLSPRPHRSHPSASTASSKLLSSIDVLFLSNPLSLILPPRARSCPILQS